MMVVRLTKQKKGYKTVNLLDVAKVVRAMAIEDGLIYYARIFQNDRELCTMVVDTALPSYILKHKLQCYCQFVDWLVEE